ncbi:MAG: DNA-binding transcriptional LysR family regulator [Candidatus Pseudothioglobus sp.]|jgi:DNA-binding transcriptional LysR family regulator
MPIHIETQEIRVFKAICDHQGFQRAADKLFISQSAVSQTILGLEKKLDSRLLQRNPLKLTEAGARLLDYAHMVLSEEDHVLTDINNIKHGISSTLSLAISGTAKELYADQLLAAFLEASPLTRIKLSVMPSRQIISAVSSDLWELGFGPFQQVMPATIEIMPLFEDQRTLMVSRENAARLKAGDKIGVSKLPLIVSHLDEPDMRPAIDKLRNHFGNIWEISDTSLRIKLVARGLGMAYLDEALVARHENSGELQAVEFARVSRIPLQFGLFYPRGQMLSSGALRFIELCKQFNFDRTQGS